MKVKISTISKIVAIFVVILLIATGFLYRNFNSIKLEWSENKSKIDSQISDLLVLNRQIGYGGFVHHFKNLVLRTNQKYRDQLIINYKTAMDTIDKIKNKSEHPQIIKDLNIIKSTLDEYFKNLNDLDFSDRIAIRDQKVRVDDTDAIKAMNELLNFYFNLRSKYEGNFQSNIYQFEKMILMVFLCLFIAFFVMLFFLLERINLSNDLLYKEQLKNSSQLVVSTMSEVSGSLHHEILNPLQIISSHNRYLNRLAMSSKIDKDTIIKSAKKIEYAINRVSSIVNGVANYTEQTRKGMEKNDLSELVEEAVLLSRYRFVAANIELDYQRHEEHVWVNCIASEISIALMLLINNFVDVLKFSKMDEKKIKIEVNVSKEKVQLKVSKNLMDSGFNQDKFDFLESLIKKNKGFVELMHHGDEFGVQLTFNRVTVLP